MCEVFGVSTSGYYAWEKHQEGQEISEREKQNGLLDEQIKFHFYDNLMAFGSPRIHDKLVNEDGLMVSQKKVANRIRDMGLFATKPRKYINTTDSNHQKPVYPNELNRQFRPEAPNRDWVTDITYIHIGEGFIYLTEDRQCIH